MSGHRVMFKIDEVEEEEEKISTVIRNNTINMKEIVTKLEHTIR